MNMLYAAFVVDTALGKFTAIVKLDSDMSQSDARSDAISLMHSAFGGTGACKLGNDARVLRELPSGAWQEKCCYGWGWMVKGALTD